MSFNDYKDPIISQWHMSDGHKYSKVINNESHTVVDGMFALIGLPDISERVVINGYVEIDLRIEITATNQFKVDYANGYVFVHSGREGQSINVSRYASRGVSYYPASRIWTKKDNFGNVSETASEMFDKVDYINGVTNRLDDTITDAKSTNTTLKQTTAQADSSKIKLDTSINNANSINNTLSHATTGTIRKATNTNDALSRTIGTANISKSNLDGSIDASSTSKTNLDSSISSANSINDTLSNETNGTIKRAKDRNDKLDSSISTSEMSKAKLDTSIAQSTQRKTDLDDSINVANNTNVKLDGTIDVANEKNDILQGSINTSDVNIAQVVDIMNNSTLIYKTAVDTYSSLSTTYPNAEKGYFVNVLDTKKWYRYDGISWIHISTFDGTDFDTIFNYAKYIWIEEVTVDKNALLFTLPNSVGSLDKLIIKDTKYQAEWLEGIHWNRIAQTVSFTEVDGLPEKLTFIIKNIGKDLKLEVDDSKVNLDDHASTKKTELNSHTVAKKNELNSYRTEKELQLDSYTTTKEEQLNAHTNVKKSELSSTIDNANTKDLELKETIANSNSAKSNLDGSISDSTLKKTSLDSSIALANTSNDTLNTTVDSATVLKTGLDESVASGTALKGDLDAILEGADLVGMAQDVANLKTDSHIHSNKDVLNELSDNLGQLKYKGLDVGIGDMEKSVYDTNNNGKVDKAEDSDTVNGFTVESNVPPNAEFTDTVVDVSNKAEKAIVESESILKGGSSLTLTHTPKMTDTLQIVDDKYGIKWFKGKHWNISNKTITFTSPMPENLTFEIINMG